MTKEKDGGIQVYFRDKEGNKIIPKKHRITKKWKANIGNIFLAAGNQAHVDYRELIAQRVSELLRDPSLIRDETWKEVSIY